MLILLLQGVGIWFCLALGVCRSVWRFAHHGGCGSAARGLFLLLARRALSRPLLPETRALVRRTITAICRNAADTLLSPIPVGCVLSASAAAFALLGCHGQVAPSDSLTQRGRIKCLMLRS